MASLVSKLVSRLRRAFGGRPKPPSLKDRLGNVRGHGGIAAGKLPSMAGEQRAQKLEAEIAELKEELVEMRREGADQQEINETVVEIDALKKRAEKERNPQQFEKYGGTKRWWTLYNDVVAGFVYDQDYLPVHSSNVAAAQYFITDQKLMVEFRSGAAYLYSNVTEQEAVQFATALSKGGFCWDVLRVRGSKTAHKKPYSRIR